MFFLLYPTILEFLSYTQAYDFMPDYESFHEATGFTDACWFGDDAENVCKNNGFCSTNSAGDEAACDCTYGWGGEFCSEHTLVDLCGDMFCYNNGECVVGLDGETGASCVCATGWTGESCLKEDWDVDVCAGVTCSDNGHCNAIPGLTDKYECVCNVGFGGATCGETLDSCSGVFMMDIFVRLVDSSGNLNATMECGYSTPTLFEDVHPAMYDDETFSYCVCADVWTEYGYDDYLNQLSTCVMDSYRPYSFLEETESYCPYCDDTQDAVMESLITSKSDTCYHFVYERETMPLYWRTVWKCACMVDIGTPSTIETVVNCPFTKHSSKNDFISWENCRTERMCEWKDMYRYFEEDYSQIDLEGSALCKDWMEQWIFVTPDDHVLLEDMTATFCPCLEAVRGHCDGCEFALDCVPVTFHQLSMLDAFDKLCNDDRIKKRDCINYISYIGIELGTLNFTAATMCYSAMDLGNTLSDLSSNLKSLLCGCVGPAVTLLSDDSYQSDNIDLALSCIDEAFSMDLQDCPSDVYDGDEYWIPVSTDYQMETVLSEADVRVAEDLNVEDDMEAANDEEMSSDDFIPPVENVQFSTNYWDSSSSWKTVTIVEVAALVILSGSAFGLNKKRVKITLQ